MFEKNKKLPIEVSENLPAYLTSDGALGIENITADDVVIPRLKIVQGQTTAKEANPDLKDGEFYHSVSNESLGKEIELFVLLMWNSRIWFSDGQKWLGAEFTDINTKERVRIGDIDFTDKEVYDKGIKCYNYMVVLNDQVQESLSQGVLPEILIFTCASAAQKPARNLNGRLQMNGRKKFPIFAQKVKVTTTLKKFSIGSAYMPSFSFPNLATENEAKVLKALFQQSSKLQSNKAAHEETEKEPDTSNTETAKVENPFDDLN
jgi:hypothetical protein